jgi:ATP-dependent Lhr-like helicase
VLRAPEPRTRGRDLIDQWLASKGWRAWPFQQQAWEAYAAGRSGLIQVATGAGKTYGAYLGPLAELIDETSDCGFRTADWKSE